jgi:hypothetical protein
MVGKARARSPISATDTAETDTRKGSIAEGSGCERKTDAGMPAFADRRP